MTGPTTAFTLLRDAESYLSALHGSVARHDHLAANLGCAGCELRDRIGAALPELAAASDAPLPPADQGALLDLIADALADTEGWQWAPGFDKTQSPTYQGYLRQAAAVLPVLPTPADQAAVLREAADVLEEGDYLLAAEELRRMADETAATEETHVVADDSDDPEHVDDCPGCTAAGARQDGAQR
ncbi:hypothetical protein [Streptomyces sp. NPDC017230]|uniref:hypothetical protein n=1 Tax=unclassified Streptomyces TaxID=2593676 RepID=UPI0037B40EC3